MSGVRLTKRVLNAMSEALEFRLAGEIENYGYDDDIPIEDYEDACRWVSQQLAKRSARP